MEIVAYLPDAPQTEALVMWIMIYLPDVLGEFAVFEKLRYIMGGLMIARGIYQCPLSLFPSFSLSCCQYASA